MTNIKSSVHVRVMTAKDSWGRLYELCEQVNQLVEQLDDFQWFVDHYGRDLWVGEFNKADKALCAMRAMLEDSAKGQF